MNVPLERLDAERWLNDAERVVAGWTMPAGSQELLSKRIMMLVRRIEQLETENYNLKRARPDGVEGSACPGIVLAGVTHDHG